MLNYSINSLAASPTAPNLDTATPSRQAGSQAGEQRNTEGQAAQGKAASAGLEAQRASKADAAKALFRCVANDNVVSFPPGA